jgi:protein-S-isoprenylcysteine O-methyltransferase Ste14
LQLFSLLAYGGGIFAIYQQESFALEQSLSGIALLILSFFLFWYAARTTAKAKFTLAFSQDAPTRLERSGPYRWIRNPFYTSYISAYTAVWVTTSAHWFLLILVPVVTIYMIAVKDEERKFLESSLASEYRLYLKQAGRFLPKISIPYANIKKNPDS